MAFAYQKPAVPCEDDIAATPLEPGGTLRAPSGRGALGWIATMVSLVLADTVAIQAAFLLGAELYSIFNRGEIRPLDLDSSILVAALMLPLGFCLLDVYRVHGQAPIERFPLRIKATCVLFALLAVWHYSNPGAHWPLAALGATVLFALVLPLVGEGAARRILIRCGIWGMPAVVIGAGPTGQQVVRILKQTPELGLRPVAFFDDDWQTAPTLVENVPLLGSVADSALYRRRIHTAIMTAEAQNGVGGVAMGLGFRNIIVVPDLRDLPTLCVRTHDLNGLIGLQMRCNLLLRRNRLMKQTIDYLIALPLFVASVPIIAVLAFWIMLASNGPPFYAQLRPGKDERPIKVWKLRTMHPDAEARLQRYLDENPAARHEWERYYKLSDDPRVLPVVGKFLRRTSLDELPQIYNVIRGEMSLVGPRPFPDYHLNQFDRTFRMLRASVIPGITGLWQVSARSDGDLQVQQALDTYYIRNWSIWMDLYVLSRTLGAVLAGRGAR
jgi:Undecaprenyl-phosphate galactose phosphotransferase WbaP